MLSRNVGKKGASGLWRKMVREWASEVVRWTERKREIEKPINSWRKLAICLSAVSGSEPAAVMSTTTAFLISCTVSMVYDDIIITEQNKVEI